MQDQGYKRCRVCGETKLQEEFYRCSGRKCRRTICKTCELVRGRERVRLWRQANKDAVNAARRAQYLKDNPGVRSRPKIDPKDRVEQARQRTRAWLRAHPEQARANSRRGRERRRALLRGVQFIETVDPLVVLERDDGCCGICGGDVDPFDFHVDHIVPLSKGGEHSYRNTQPAHPVCNVRKGAQAP